MKLTLTLTNSGHTLEKDVQVNSQQKIIDTLNILQDAGVLWELSLFECRVKSLRKGIYLDSGKNYEEEYILNGDILELS